MSDHWFSYLVYLIATVLSFGAFAFRSIALLRIFTAVSSFLYVIYYAVFPSIPMWPDILSEGAMVGINLVMLAVLWYNQRKMAFTEEEKELYRGLFSRLSPFEFFKLIKIARWKTAMPGDVLARKGVPVMYIYLLYNGEVCVSLDERREVRLSDGDFIGEMSFSLDRPANADVVVREPSRLLYWSQEELRQFLERNPATKDAFNAIITQDLAKKLSK